MCGTTTEKQLVAPTCFMEFPCSKTGRLPMKPGTDCVGVYAGALWMGCSNWFLKNRGTNCDWNEFDEASVGKFGSWATGYHVAYARLCPVLQRSSCQSLLPIGPSMSLPVWHGLQPRFVKEITNLKNGCCLWMRQGTQLCFSFKFCCGKCCQNKISMSSCKMLGAAVVQSGRHHAVYGEGWTFKPSTALQTLRSRHQRVDSLHRKELCRSKSGGSNDKKLDLRNYFVENDAGHDSHAMLWKCRSTRRIWLWYDVIE